MVKISVIIPVYKDPDGLKKTLDSLVQQSLPINEFDVIIINDGGDEYIIQLEKEYQKYSCFRFIHRSPNKGSYFSRNEGIEIATSENLAFIDADCVASHSWLETGLKYLDAYDYVAGNIEIDYQQVNSISTYHDFLTAFPIKEYFSNEGFGVTANLFVKKIIFDKIGLFNSVLYSGGDLEFGFRVSQHPELKRIYAEDCVVFHSPRDHKMKVHKIRRVRKGQLMLKKQFPDQYSFLKRPFIHKVKSFLPPSYSSFKKIYKYDKNYGRLRFYLYMFQIKIIKGLIEF